MPVQKWGYFTSSHLPRILANISQRGDPVGLEGQKMTTRNTIWDRRGGQTNDRNASICRKGHRTGASQLSEGIRCARAIQEFPGINKDKGERQDKLKAPLETCLYYVLLSEGQGHLDTEIRAHTFPKITNMAASKSSLGGLTCWWQFRTCTKTTLDPSDNLSPRSGCAFWQRLASQLD